MDWFSRNRIWITGAGFFILSTVLRFLAANQTQHPSGWDGYYYVMQVHSWIRFGHMQSPDFSLIYPFFAVITLIVGDPILGFKIGVAIISGLLTISVYYYLVRRSPIAWIACAYIVFSPLVTFFILQFPKNALGLVFFIFFISSLKKPGLVTAAFFIATVLTHRMTGALALLSIIFFIPWRWTVVAFVVIVIIGFLPGILHISDLLRFEGQFTSMPHWAPLAFTRVYPTSLHWFFKAELILVSAAILICVALIIKNRLPETWIWFCIVIISVFPFFSFTGGDIGHRFFMITPVATIILLGLLVRSFPKQYIGTVFLVVISVFSYRSYKPSSFDAPNNSYITIAERLVKRYDPHQYPLVIAHKGLAEIIIFKTDFDALNWLPPDNIPINQVLRISHTVRSSDFDKYLSKEDRAEVKTIASGYFVTPEVTWQRFVENATKDANPAVSKRIFGGSNPMDQRPYFIGKGKKK